MADPEKERHGEVLARTLNRPATRNALSPEMKTDLRTILSQVAELMSRAFASRDSEDGRRAQAEKRAPEFLGV